MRRRSPEWRHALGVEDTILSWAASTSIFVVNRPSAVAGNASKPYQLAQLCSLGFVVPETLITTGPEAVKAYVEEHGTVIFTSISGMRSIVSRLTLRDMQRIDDVTSCPTQFQEYIPGVDYRLHVLGEKVFACEILSRADDCRYAAQEGFVTDVRAGSLQPQHPSHCNRVAAALNFAVCGS